MGRLRAAGARADRHARCRAARALGAGRRRVAAARRESPVSYQRIAVIGAGAWGTALANTTARAGRDVMLWARDPAVVALLTTARENPRLFGIRLDDRVAATGAI